MTARDSARLSGALAVLILLDSIWGYGWVVVKIGLRHAPPLSFAALRSVVATVVLFSALALSGRSLRPRAVGACALIGVLQSGLFIAATSFATMYGAVGRTSVLVFTMPFWTLIFARIVLGERLHGSQWGAVALAATGLAIVVDPSRSGGSLLSALLAVVGGALWGAGAVLTKRLDVAHRTDPLSFTAWQLFFGTLPLAALAALVPSGPIDWTVEFAAALTFSGAISTGLGWLLWTWVLKRLPAGTAGLTTLAIPVIAVLGAWLQLGERPATRELVGMATIGAALAWVSAASPRRTGEALDDAVPE